MFTVASDALLSVQAPSLRYYSNRVSPAKKSIKLDFFFYCLLRTRNKHYVFTAKSDAALSVQALSLRYYTNRVSPAKTYLIVSLFYYIVTNTQKTLSCLRLR